MNKLRCRAELVGSSPGLSEHTEMSAGVHLHAFAGSLTARRYTKSLQLRFYEQL